MRIQLMDVVFIIDYIGISIYIYTANFRAMDHLLLYGAAAHCTTVACLELAYTMVSMASKSIDFN
jgi:hypothetical protein